MHEYLDKYFDPLKFVVSLLHDHYSRSKHLSVEINPQLGNILFESVYQSIMVWEEQVEINLLVPPRPISRLPLGLDNLLLIYYPCHGIFGGIYCSTRCLLNHISTFATKLLKQA